MQQHEFIWVARSQKINDVKQDETGNTIVNLRPQVQIIHNYKKKNHMQIVFTEDQFRFLILSTGTLKEIYNINATADSQSVLRKYCEDNLERI
jgi:hypothetical protein